MADINKVVMTGNLTSDPELRSLPSGASVCKLRVACNTRRRDNASGEWVDKPNYFDAKIFGRQGEVAHEHLAKGRGIALEGRLEWREWEASDGSGKRQGVEIIVDNFRFIGGGNAAGNGGGNGESQAGAPNAAADDLPF